MKTSRRAAGAALVLFVAAVCATAALAAPPLVTAVFDPNVFTSPQSAIGFTRTKAAGASLVRLTVSWRAVAPAVRPAAFDAADPNDPAYAWLPVDAMVRGAVAAGLQPVLDVIGTAPAWAQSGVQREGRGPVTPKPAAVGAFAAALAARYAGSSLPRVRYFQLWNEPNLGVELMPQSTTSAALWYRAALNAFAAAVHRVHPDNLVIGGALAPYGPRSVGGAPPVTPGVAPMSFIRTLLCMSRSDSPTCNTRVDVDVWAFQPYTWGGPTHKAYSRDDIAIGDIPRAEALLEAARRAGNLTSRGPLRFWVTEFSWDTDPPDPKGLGLGLQARWTSEALYRLWSDHVGVVTWFLLRDMPFATSPFQSGLYFAGPTIAQDRPKPTLRAFQFPFVALRQGGGYQIWGRTPDSRSATIAVQLRAGPAWKRVLTLRAGPNGIFAAHWQTPLRSGQVRAEVETGAEREVSLLFGLRPVPDRRVSPFGSS